MKKKLVIRKFLPRPEANLVTWLQNLVAEIEKVGNELGMMPEEIRRLQELATGVITRVGAANAARTELQKIAADKDSFKMDALAFIVTAVAHLKANPAWTPSHAKALRTDSSRAAFDSTTYKPVVKATIEGNFVNLRILKYGAEALNIYAKSAGDTGFVLLERISRSRYIDRRTLTISGIAEIRQYMIMGVLNDKEIGFPSDIITISFGG